MSVPPSNAETGRPPAGYWPSSLSFTLPAATAEYVSVALGGLLFALIGIAMAWSIIFIVIAALGFALCTWLARSLARALMCAVGSLGALAAILALGSKFVPDLITSLGISWALLFVLWWVAALAGAAAFRRGGSESDFGLAEMLGCGASILVAAVISTKLDFDSDLLPFLVNREDNAAWIGTATQIATSDIVSPIFSGPLGPVIPLLLGLLGRAQQTGVPLQNATFGAFAFAIALTPLAATSLLRKLTERRGIVIVAFSALVILWAYHLPSLLATDYGHLSAIWVFLATLLGMSFVMFDRFGAWALPVGLGLAAFVGAAWFPVAPLAACLAIAICFPLVRNAGRNTRLAAAVLLGIGLVALYLQVSTVGLGLGSADGLTSLNGLYSAPGGTASLDPILLVVTLAATVGIAHFAARADKPTAALAIFVIGMLAYLTAVYALGALLQIPLGYAITKITFVLGFCAVVALIAAVPRFRIPALPLTAAVIALAFASLIYGGASELLTRRWPGKVVAPAWLVPLEAALASQNPSQPRPVACFSTDGAAAYTCTRFAGALSKAGDGDFLAYRAAIVTGPAQTGDAVAGLRASGVLAKSDIVMLTRPTRTAAWGFVMQRDGASVFGPNGQLLRGR